MKHDDLVIAHMFVGNTTAILVSESQAIPKSFQITFTSAFSHIDE
jgi:hypothetical protein